MKNALSLFSLLVLSFGFFCLPTKARQSEENPFRRLEIFTGPSRPPQARKSSQIKDIQSFGEQSGIAWTRDALFRTNDNGETWSEIEIPKRPGQKISTAVFFDEIFWIVLADEKLELLRTADGVSWTSQNINLFPEDLLDVDLENVRLQFLDGGDLLLSLPLPSGSNFWGDALYESKDGGKTWKRLLRAIQKRRAEIENNDNSNWKLTSEGTCEGFKVGCTVESKIYFGIKEITPPEIKELSRTEKENAKLEARNSIFAQPPAGSTRISLNRGFDKCTAAPASQMQTWWDHSYFYDSNIYISGRNRGCSQPQLTAAWVNQVSAMGWGLIPTVVGFQAPCSTCASCQKHSSDTATAETQGRGEADIAIADANNLGLTQGTVLYYDMERYDETAQTPNCRVAVNAFLKGWTDRLHELGYVSGVYGSPTNAVGDWVNIPAPSRMDAVWLARWDNVPSVWFYAAPSPPVPDTAWANHQRIKQWQAPHNETWGGVTFNIDGNIADAPVAGIQPPKNKNADFDGDGKTDISVWRPDTGVWYIFNSSNATYTIVGFGLSTDVLAPGDFDGDGKTDLAVWRPGDGVWHLYSRSIYRSFQFGANGDVPVPADYDGDGRTDLAVFRPSSGVWYVWNSFDSRGTSFRIEQFGITGDKPVTGDYDGDGKADLAVWRPSDGVWYLLRSTQGFTAIGFGLNGDKPAEGDFDGDGKTDLGIFRDGVWYLYQSTAGTLVYQFGIAGDLPVTGDFDGDGKADISVFRPSNGVWYLQQSQNGFTAMQFGIETDKPIPNAYLPQ